MIDPKAITINRPFHTEKDFTQKKRNLTRTANSLASAIRNNDLELSPDEQRALTVAYGVLERGCAIYGKAAAIAKQNALDRAKRLDQARALVKARFGGLDGIADRVAFIAATRSFSFDEDTPAVRGLKEAADKAYWANEICKDLFAEAMENTAYRASADFQKLPLADCVEQYWNKFQEVRPTLLQKHAAIIVLVQEALAVAKA